MRVCFVLLITVLSLTSNALASCPIFIQGPPCQEYWRADAVFIGVATRVEHTPYTTPLGITRYERTATYMRVEEAFKGIAGAEVVFNSQGCAHVFKEGVRYLVYAHRYKNELYVTHNGTRTRPISEAVEDLDYIRGIASEESGSRVFGNVSRFTFNIKKGEPDRELLKDAKITLRGNNHNQEVVTDSEGRYEFKRVPAGTYRVRSDLGTELQAYNSDHTINVIGHGCVNLNFFASRTSEIDGTVSDVNGELLASVPISLVPADASSEEILAEGKDKPAWAFTLTSPEGHFSFSRLPPGRYLLVINRTEFERSRGNEKSRALPRLFYPGVTDIAGATVIDIDKDSEQRKYVFRLPLP